MNRIEILFASPLLTLARHDHPQDRAHRDPAEEIAADHAMAFVERGSFDVHTGRRRWRLSPDSLFVTRPGMVYRCRHVAGVDDVCLSIRLPDQTVADLETATGRGWNDLPPVVRATNRLAYLRHRLVRSVAAGADGWATHELAGELFAALDGSREGGAPIYRARQLAWYAERVEAARRILHERYAEPLSLEHVAREAGMSPFHFSRVFKELVGLPPHRYLVKIRLARAAEQLRAGAGVTQTSLATGFNNLGHFIRTFHRAFGVSPSRCRD